MDSYNNPSPLLSHAHALPQSSSKERPCGHVATLASYERCSMPPVNDSTTPPLSSVGSSSEERPDFLDILGLRHGSPSSVERERERDDSEMLHRPRRRYTKAWWQR
ncbi:hypothetical protein K438DRAFT_1777865 [Mycena galopus ATCC 62051]|nr:hypothetical protein K438DRAFT_1777865 [Mycena galopus ATCC 62051]